MKTLADYLKGFSPAVHDAGVDSDSIQAQNRLSGAAYDDAEQLREQLGDDWEVECVSNFGREVFFVRSEVHQPGQLFVTVRGTQPTSLVDHLRNVLAIPVTLRLPPRSMQRWYREASSISGWRLWLKRITYLPRYLFEIVLGGAGKKVLPGYFHTHAGYTVLARALFWPSVEILDRWTEGGERPVQVRFCGHSAGAASVAILALLLFKYKRGWFRSTISPGSGVTLGASNGFNYWAAQWFPFRWLSIIQDDDMIGLVPPWFVKPGTLAMLCDRERRAHIDITHPNAMKRTGKKWGSLALDNMTVDPTAAAAHTVKEHGWGNYMIEWEESLPVGDWPGMTGA